MSKSNATRVRYDRETVVNAVLEGIANGLSLRTLCKGKGMPKASTVCTWLTEDQSFGERYARAREADGQLTGEQIAEIAHKVLRGELEPNAARVAMDGLKWTASRKAPRVYGDSTRIDLRREVTHLVAFCDMTPLSARAELQDGYEGPPVLPNIQVPDGAEVSLERPEGRASTGS